MAGLLILMTFMGLREAYGDLQKYGWTYTQITIVGEEITETVISVGSQMFATLFFGLLGIIYLRNIWMVKKGYTIDFAPLKEGDVTGITFPRGKPDTWDLSVDLRTRVVDVTLNNLTMSFPLTKIQGWIEQHEKKKMEKMK